MIGFRYGEALNPGPASCATVTFAVINPTTILDKEWQIQQVGADVLLASETSANQKVQKIMSSKLRGLGFRCMWGAPTADRFHNTTGQHMLRSYAQGVAAFSRLPCRPPLHPLADDLLASCRITECFVRVQALDIKLIVIYGVPRCLPDAAQHNDHLLSWAYQRASISCVPTIIGGDFNTLPQDLPAWESFANRGWVELGEFATSAHGLELPCTCKGATRFDTFLLPPSLLQFFHGADVLEDCHLFDSHSPMRLHLRVPSAVVPRWIWPCPKDFTTIVRDCAQLEQNYLVQSASVRTAFSDSVPEAKDGDKIRLWAHTIEEAVHSTIRDQHLSSPQQQEYRGLPKAFRGRCKEVDRKQACPPRLPRLARHGDPEPYDEDTTVLGRQRVRQLRRLVTFQQGMAGYRACSGLWPLLFFLGSSVGFPDLAFVDDLVDFVRFDVQAVNRQHAKVKSNLFRYKLQIDVAQYGCAQAFAAVRPPSKPPFQCVQLTSAQEAVTVDVHSHQLRCFRVPDPNKYNLLSQVFFMNVPGQVTQKRADTVTVLFPQDDDVVLPLCGQEADIAHWPQFSSMLHRLTSVAGCLKQRSVVDLSYCVQAEIEACLSKVQRHFEVLGSLGPGLPSTTGAPEGDPISVLAMLGICFVLVASLHNLVQARTYMDNWTWTADLPDCDGPALLILMDLTSSLRLEIDWKKTYVWGTEKTSQTWWRDIGPAFLPTGVDLPVIQHVKELGAFLQFSRKPHRKGFASRVEDAQARLHKLARTPQSGYARARVLQSGIWPFLFFGSEGLSPALTTMQQIRGSAARAVAGNHHTISPFAALYLCPHAQNPEVYVLCHHLRQFRRMGDLFPRLAQTVWQRVTGPHIGQRSVCGPAGALQNLLRRNQWVPKSDGWCKGPLNCAFHVFRSSPQQLTRAVELAWADTVQDNIQHRVGLQAAPPPNARVCHKVLQGLRSWEQKILLRHFAGGYLSGAEKHSWSRGDYEACPLCGLRDTKAHRIFDCPVLQPARQDHTCVLQQVRHEQPHWTHMTFASLPPQADILHLLLQGLRLPPLAPPAPPGRRLCLFTDGSGRHSQVPLARLVTWAVVLADPAACTAIAQREPGAQERGFTVLATGCVPGEQTVPRAEICALIWASAWANQSGGPTEIFVDCQPAIDIWEQWHREGFAAVRRKAAADLFRDVQPQGPCNVYKVKAHQTWQEWLVASERDRWIACGNEAADTAAKSAYDQLPEFLRTTADEVASHCLSQQKLLRKFCRALLAVGLQDIKLRAAIPTAAPAVSTSSGEQLDGFIQTFGSWQPPLCACQLPDHLEENWDGWVFGAAFGRKLLDWLRWVQWPEQPVAPEFAGSISYLELLSHFTMMTGSPPPTVRTTGTKQKYLPLCQALDDLLPCPTCSLVTVFRAALKQLGQRYNFTVIPAVDVKNVAHLQWFGVTAPSPGVNLRPYLPGQWLADFRWICEGDVAHRLGSFCRA
ncbi:hypothetical protein AK812_SmicGene3898 [Symbiodinium microadriaticum]|uniref:Uncharacterized protein n=1 Tax=Symbiodinium microadriaticum TaxID=2951 RepID=A0A1Q9EXQ1_SYMMI|nr:hypothetical protein AK812_SmicGene3898 [Symbiodinium microadriaticum]